MNILPKKRWHVRTRENIARVRRDEAEAAEQERIRQERIKLAEKEARRALLLKRSRELSSNEVYKHEDDQETSSIPDEHVNFFKDLQQGTAEIKRHNTEHDKEEKEEREKYEKQIGYLTYLGQDTNEALGKKSWYDVVPDRSDVKGEANLKSKIREDPLQVMQKYSTLLKKTHLKSYNDKSKFSSKSHRSDDQSLGTEKEKSRVPKRKPSSESSEKNSSNKKLQNLELLRRKRLIRENEERIKAEMLLSKLNGNSEREKQDGKGVSHSYKSRYNSQFNPELARQNYK